MKFRKASWVGLLSFLICVLWASTLVQIAQAHALLVRSLPEADAELTQPPAKIEMWFSEPLEAGFSQARLLDSSGKDIPSGAVLLDPFDLTHMTLPLGQLGPGVYTVAWQTLSQADGHEYSGSFPITVLNPDGTRPSGEPATGQTAGGGDLPSPGETIARWFLLLGGMLLFAAPLFQYLVAPDSRQPGWHDSDLIKTSARDLALRAIWIAALALTVGHGLHIMLQSMRLGGLYQLPDLLLRPRAGVLLLARQAMVFTALLVILRLPQPKPLKGCERPVRFGVAAGYVGVIILLSMALVRGEFMLAGIALAFAVLGAGVASWSPGSESRTWAVFTLLAGVLLLSISFGSHAGGAPGSFWAVLGDYVHLSAAATWVGGLILVTLLLWQVHHTPNPRLSADPRSSVLLVRRFSYLASFSVFVLLLTGLFSSIVELPDLPALWETAYGRVLLVKLGLLTLALSVAFFNNRLVHGRINGLKSSIPPKRLYIQMGVEAVVTLGLMLSVAVLVQTTAPRGQASAEKAVQPALPFNSVINAADLTMHVQVDPNQVGSNRFWLHLYHGDGSQIGEVQLVQLRFNHRQASLGQSSVDLEPQGHDTFAVEGAYLSQPGTWDLYVYIRRRGIDDVLEQLNLDVPVPGISVSVSKPWQNPAPTLPPTLLAVWGLIALGLVPLVWRQPLVETWPRLYPAYRRAGISVVVIGLVFSIVWLVNGGGSAALGAHGSRIPPSPSSIEQGKALYEQNCLPCHGSVGLGDGPAALALIPRPANLQVHMVAGVHTDEQIYAWITNGFPNSAMPAFSDLLTGEERWHVLNYIRTLTPQGSP